ncbi:MAG TPA: thioredoxin-like domain-containing protein [Gemmataceae bacterium]|nr:thioredoxin-like domain-containing protein [Gemmataceae bacterium]
MSLPPESLASSRPVSHTRWWILAVGLPLIALMGWYLFQHGIGWPARPVAAQEPTTEDAPKERRKDKSEDGRPEAPELNGGVAWLNTAGPVRMKDLRGKIVLLDFWTLCCINCIHTLPDLARLEKKYPNELVVVGIHTAKFDNEKNTESIRKAILRYEISHPVVNDANQRIWNTYGSRSWPTLCLIDPEGRVVGSASGEGNYELLDRVIAKLIKIHKEKKTLNEKPLKFQLARNQENGDSPLFFPGKVLADAASKRVFIADSTHHRIVITDLDGKKIAIAGVGEPGKADGPFAKAGFNDPQGMALQGDVLYVADRKNHLIRALDLKAQTVKTVAGIGTQGTDREMGGAALKTGLNSPWALLLHKDRLYIAMAGHHQIWTMDLEKGKVAPFAGSGRENIRDGSLITSCFAQPSGLATDGKTLWVADSEVSAVRAVPLEGDDEVKTVVGEGLFEFGDKDGQGNKVRLQHALGLAYHEGKLYVADTYNSKIKLLDPVKRTCTTFLGGEPEGWLAGPVFSEPGGISYSDGKLYVADTNAHRIRVVDLKTKTVSTLKLQGVEAPKLAR